MKRSWQYKVDKRLGLGGRWGILVIFPLIILLATLATRDRAKQQLMDDVPVTTYQDGLFERRRAERCPDCSGEAARQAECTTCRQTGYISMPLAPANP